MLRANRPLLAFFDAIKALRVRQLALILKAGYDPNLMINGRGQNGLQFMINYFNATDAHFRLQAPINKSAYLSMAKLLLDSGLDANALDLLTDETVLFDAIRFNDREMVALLLNYVDLSLRNKAGETALMCAARFGSKQVVRLMLEHLHHLEMDGYFLRQRNRLGLTPLELARAENLEAAKVLARHLIAYGHHHQVLARSASHHQLASRATRAPAVAADLLDCADLSASDYEQSAPLAGHPEFGSGAGSALVGGFGRAGPAAVAGPRRPPMAAYYDPKAAEFSAYLLEQHQDQLMAAVERGEQAPFGRGPAAHAANARPLTDDDDLDDDEDARRAAFGLAGQAGRGGAGGPLVRSRSCMLGPASVGGAQAAGSAPKQQSSGASTKKSAESGWRQMNAN